MGSLPLAPGRLRTLALIGAALATGACFRLVGPEDPAEIPRPELVSVMVEYRQPLGCLSLGSPTCDDKVVFFASWTRPGGEFPLERVGNSNVWRGVAEAVPVNYPPRDAPYQVRVFDPYLSVDVLGGITANRITVGGEQLNRFENVGSRSESALVYIDEEGRGHNAF